MVVGSEDERDLIDWVLDLCELFTIPKLRSIGITEKDFETVIEKASHASSMKGNPIKLTREELLTILEYAY
jgi:alcohol dehydrogenase class IV